MQVGAVHIEPGFGALMVRTDALHQAPESRRVVHLDEVRHFMGGEIIKHLARRQDEPPGE